MLPQARPKTAESSWIDVVQAHLRARSHRVIGRSEKASLLDELRATRALSALQPATYPDSDVLRVPPEVAADVDPTRFVTSTSSVGVGVLHRWMSASWVEKRFWRSLHGVAEGGQLTVLPLRLSALGRSFSALVATDIPPLMANLVRLASLDSAVAGMGTPGGDAPGARMLVAGGGRLAHDERFICTSVDDKVLWSCGWYSGPAQVIEEALGVGFPALECLSTPGTWAAPATVTRFEERHKSPTNVALVGGAWDERLAASWARGVGKRGSAHLLGDGPHWFAQTKGGVVCAPPLAGSRLPLRALHAPEAAAVLARLHRSLLFTNAASTEAGLPWWDDRGDTAPGELVEWGGMTMRPQPGKRATHPDASVIVPYGLLREPNELTQSYDNSAGDLLDAVVFVVDVHAPEALLLEARSWPEAIALAIGFDALGSGNLHDPLGLRSFPGDASAGLRAWLDLGAENAPRVFVWTVPRHSGKATRVPPTEIIGLVADAVHGHPAAAKSPLGGLRASSKSHLEPRAVIDSLGRALDELGSRCPPALRRAHHAFLAEADA